MNHSVLLIDDDVRLCELLRTFLTGQGFVLSIANTAEGGLKNARRNEYQLIILDIMLPKRDGLSVCSDLRRRNIRTPILILTARDTVADRVAGLDSGADDYLVKPFAFQELLARMRALSPSPFWQPVKVRPR